MACPGIGEVGGCVGVTLLAGCQQIGLYARFGIVGAENFVNAMTIVANGFVGVQVGILVFKEGNGCAVKIGNVGIEYLG